MALLDTLLSRKNFAELQRQWRAAACCGLPLSPWFRSPRGSRSARPVATALFRMSAYKATRRGRRAVPARRVLTLHANVHLVDNLGMVSMCKVGSRAAASGAPRRRAACCPRSARDPRSAARARRRTRRSAPRSGRTRRRPSLGSSRTCGAPAASPRAGKTTRSTWPKRAAVGSAAAACRAAGGQGGTSKPASQPGRGGPARARLLLESDDRV